MDLRKLKTIIDLFENSQVSELEILDGEDKVRLVRHHATWPPSVAVQEIADKPARATKLDPKPPETGAPKQAPPPPPADEEPAADGEVLVSPMVGTLYRASDPETDPFVRVGDKVTKGQVMFIVEAMKLMNEIGAPCDGTVAEIAVENGAPVAFGDKLAVISRS